MDGERTLRTASAGECCLILAICLGLPIVNSLWVMAHYHQAVGPYRFTNAGLIGLMIFELISLCTAGYILQMKGWRHQDFGIRISFAQSGAGSLLFVIWYGAYVFL